MMSKHLGNSVRLVRLSGRTQSIGALQSALICFLVAGCGGVQLGLDSSASNGDESPNNADGQTVEFESDDTSTDTRDLPIDSVEVGLQSNDPVDVEPGHALGEGIVESDDGLGWQAEGRTLRGDGGEDVAIIHRDMRLGFTRSSNHPDDVNDFISRHGRSLEHCDPFVADPLSAPPIAIELRVEMADGVTTVEVFTSTHDESSACVVSQMDEWHPDALEGSFLLQLEFQTR